MTRIIPANPCRIKGAGDEHPEERPVLTIAQVFELADSVGRRPVGNVHARSNPGAYRLRFQRNGEMRAFLKMFTTRGRRRAGAVEDGNCGRPGGPHPRPQLPPPGPLATFASLRWGEVGALRHPVTRRRRPRRRDRASGRRFVERATGELVLGPPKSKAWPPGRRHPASRRPGAQGTHEIYVKDEPGALLFPGAKGGALRRSGFNTRTRWVDVVKEMGMPGLHFHDLRHTGNMLAAESGAGLSDLTARMGHDNVRAALIYQHAVRCADQMITDAIDRQIKKEDGGVLKKS